MIDKKSLEIKLKKLLDLCSKNEPTDKEMKKHFLFDAHQIQAYGMYRTIQDKFEFLTSEDIIDIMRSANILWKIQNGKLPNNTLKDWMDVMKEAHQLHLLTSATMMFGHIETIEERFDHLVRIRAVQEANRRIEEQRQAYVKLILSHLYLRRE